MSDSETAAAPESGKSPDPSPLPQGERETMENDPEIRALLEAPVFDDYDNVSDDFAVHVENSFTTHELRRQSSMA
jgi:hypothetical protein